TMVAVLWTLGLRTSELTALKVKSFEIGHGKKIGLLRIRGKNKKQRALFVVDRLFDALIRYLNHPLSSHKKLAPLIPGQPNTALSNSRVQRIVKDQAKKAGIIAAVTPRVLRHSFATEMYHQNVPLDAIQYMMGHDSIADTSIYIHVSDKLKQLALDSILISRRFSWREPPIISLATLMTFLITATTSMKSVRKRLKATALIWICSKTLSAHRTCKPSTDLR
ncbi:MAG: tyrosine-type recombinase/integrase, partial [Chloroflexi bacterium]|nr:tyrosine-type recombinase/integrase [Chloroflexota bacterium]